MVDAVVADEADHVADDSLNELVRHLEAEVLEARLEGGNALL